MKAQIFCFAALACLIAACSTQTSDNSDLTEPTDSASSELGLAQCKNKCGPALGMPTILCPDGSIGGNTGRCVKDKGVCHWEIRQCLPAPPPPPPVPPPARDCTAKGACGPAPMAPVQVCSDGSTAGAVCVDKGGACGWEFTTCPPPPPPPGAECGKNTCSAKQTCCAGVPFPEPTCWDGTMCPISQRKHKKDVSYLSETDKQRLNDELLGFRLATYRYKSESAAERTHLGFIIDDVAPSPAVTDTAERVDMYGYSTMAVATLQVQARELAELRRQVDELKRQVGRANARK